MSTENYGLINLHQRLVLLYGKGYGLSILPNPHAKNGLTIRIIAVRKHTQNMNISAKTDPE